MNNKISKNTKAILWTFVGALISLLLICPLVISLLKYDSINHSKPFSEMIFSFYKDFPFPIHVDNLLILLLFLSLGGIAGYLFYRLKSSLPQPETNYTLQDLLQMRESDKMEFKSSLRWDYKQNKISKEVEFAFLKTIAAFLNTSGGTLLIGVTDDAAIIGLEKDYQSLKKEGRDFFQQYIMNLVSLNLGANCCKSIDVNFFQQDNNDVCMVKVNHIKTGVFLKNQQSTSFYIRTGNNTRELDIEEALKYFKSNKIQIP